MSTFRTPQIIRLYPEAAARSQTFADAVIAAINYRDGNQTVKQKIRDNHFVSKLGEEAIKAVFESRNCAVDGPDYSIYDSKQESWDADLKINVLEVAVKTRRALPQKKIKQLIFETPRLSRRVGKKQAVYLDTLQKHKIFK